MEEKSPLTIENGVVTRCREDATEVVIPDGVTKINGGAFSQCNYLASVTIPNSVTEIGELAFYCCYSLTAITLPNSVTEIGKNAFEDCIALKTISIPESITKISKSMFSGCSALVQVELPQTITTIEYGAFFRCKSLTSLTIPQSVTSIETVFADCKSLVNITYGGTRAQWETVVDMKAENCLHQLPTSVVVMCEDGEIPIPQLTITDGVLVRCNEYATKVVIPDDIREIGKDAFGNCTMLRSLTIPTSVTTIDESAFSGCESLKSVTLPESITEISTHAFSWCVKLSKISIPNTVTEIGEQAFSDCTALKTITIPESVRKIAARAFICCENLEAVTIPDGVTEIADNTFRACKSLASLSLPATIKRFACNALALTPLTTVTFRGTMEQWQNVEKIDDYGYAPLTARCTDGTCVFNKEEFAPPSLETTAAMAEFSDRLLERESSEFILAMPIVPFQSWFAVISGVIAERLNDYAKQRGLRLITDYKEMGRRGVGVLLFFIIRKNWAHELRLLCWLSGENNQFDRYSYKSLTNAFAKNPQLQLGCIVAADRSYKNDNDEIAFLRQRDLEIESFPEKYPPIKVDKEFREKVLKALESRIAPSSFPFEESSSDIWQQQNMWEVRENDYKKAIERSKASIDQLVAVLDEVAAPAAIL